jgi:arylsulfatase A-like enzyme/type 1 glutamine amidotransferase
VNLVVALAVVAPVVCLGSKDARPNIVVILSDDMHWHHPGFNGGPVATPNLDRLAHEGIRMTQFYVHSVCSPTRAALLTGRYPFRNGMEERSHGNDVAGMLTDERTLADALKEAGYFTAIIGKWHLGNWYDRHLPRQRGFDHQYGLYGALISYYDKVRTRTYDWHRNGETLREEGYSTDLIAREFVRVIETYDSEKPFFIYVPFNAVHGPDEAPPELTAKYRTFLEDHPDGIAPPQLGFHALKFAMLDAMDQAIGKMMKALEAKGLLDDTLVVFFNDNGGRKANPPFRGGKGDTFEGGVRVPCLWRWPGKIPTNRSVDGMMHVVDLYPTLIRQAGASLKQDLPLDGMDMWDTITGNADSPRTEVVHSLGDVGDTGVMAIRRGDYKLVGPELFNLKKDPAETTDIAAMQPAIYQSLHERLLELAKQRREPEAHTPITKTIDQPLLVFGKKENENPPASLAPYLDTLVSKTKKVKKSSGAQQDLSSKTSTKTRSVKTRLSSAELFARRDRDRNGEVTWEEYLVGRSGPALPNLKKRFEERDKDGNGIWEESEIEKLHVVLLADKKDHGPAGNGLHDYPLWQKRWSLLLGPEEASEEEQVNLVGPPEKDTDYRKGMPHVELATAWHWPSEGQFQTADVIVAYCYLQWTDQRLAQVRRYLAGGGGLVLIHSATWTKPKPSHEVAEVVGVGGFRLFRHGMVRMEVLASEHPICAGLPKTIILEDDETYWPPTPIMEEVTVLATSVEDKAKRGSTPRAAQPMFWCYELGKGRVFGCVPGHSAKTFDDPVFRKLLLRGMAWAAGEQ